jgi:hypothetical protein
VKPYLVAPEAEGDLRQIWRYLLGEAGLAIANRIQGELVDAFEGLADVPSKGHCAIACFDQALADVGLADKGALRQVLRDYFAWATTKRCPATTSPPMMCLTASASHTGHGTDSRCRTPRLTCTTPVLAPTSNLFGDFILTNIDHWGGSTLPAEGVDPC